MARFSVDRKGIAILKREPQMHAFIGRVSAQVGATAHAMSPHRSGHYDASIDTFSMAVRSVATGRVVARDFKAWWIEYGAGPSPVRGGRPFAPRAPLRKAVVAHGLRYVDKGRGYR